MNIRTLKLVEIFLIVIISLAGLHLSLAAIRAAPTTDNVTGIILPYPPARPPDLLNTIPIITDTHSQHWGQISGDCIVYREDNGWVYLHNLVTDETITVSDAPDQVRKVVISQGIVVWRSERAGANGLWGYYNPACSETKIFGDTILGPFYILSRAMSHAPALSGEMVTFDTWAPAGAWYIAMIELDANNNNTPDAIEGGYDPTDDSILIRLSCCRGGPNVTFWQRISDIYWDNDYKIACWAGTNTNHPLTPNALSCNDLTYYTETPAWDHQFVVNNDTNISTPDFQGVIAIHRDLVVWTGAREADLSGYDLYIADLDPDDDGILNPDNPEIFVLINFSANQVYPDIEWPYVVWADYRTGNGDIYGYDLSLDSDGDGIPNWRDPNRTCADQAIFPIAVDPATQTTPEISNGTAIWIDNRNGNPDIYGAQLMPAQPQAHLPVEGTSEQKAVHWLDKQTIKFDKVSTIPGYNSGSDLVLRYKSFEHGGSEHLIKAWYPAITGTYLVSFDFCNFGAPDQKRFLGRFGRGFTYDEGLDLIVRTMLSQPVQAQDLGRFVSSFQNSGQLTSTTSGSFGFSFNGQGYWGEKDNFYDMNYLRGGANGWIGYGYLFYSRQYNDPQFMDVMTGIADYLLTLQVLDENDDRYGLFTGGYGRWFQNIFFDGDRGWVSAEHNIDIYFFLRDLGRMTGDSRYLEAANLQRENIKNMWNDQKGRLGQGINDDSDALDAASWGAMYWIAVGDLEKAKRSLQYADTAYYNTVTVSNTIAISPELTISGYKPYTGTVDEFDWSDVDIVWSEGSLGVAMANLKLGHALLDQGDSQGNTYLQKAKDIVTQMEKLQSLDPNGGLFYAVYPDYPEFPGGLITDFARAPSAAGTNWMLMVQRSTVDRSMRDAFWSPDPDVPVVDGTFRTFLPLIMKK